MNPERNEHAYEGWAIVEQLGHKRMAGFVREVAMYGANLLRIDIPDGEKPITEPFATQFVGGGSIYALTPSTEAMARRVAIGSRPQPVQAWELPEMRGRALPEPLDHTLEDRSMDDDVEDDEDTVDSLIDQALAMTTLVDVLDAIRNNINSRTGEGPHIERQDAVLDYAATLLREGKWPPGDAPIPPPAPLPACPACGASMGSPNPECDTCSTPAHEHPEVL